MQTDTDTSFILFQIVPMAFRAVGNVRSHDCKCIRIQKHCHRKIFN